jgi:hypothetical protein
VKRYTHSYEVHVGNRELQARADDAEALIRAASRRCDEVIKDAKAFRDRLDVTIARWRPLPVK